ncbi:hypothetical protein Plhal304r1_c011g0041871 [Plasmopara halstedii]
MLRKFQAAYYIIDSPAWIDAGTVRNAFLCTKQLMSGSRTMSCFKEHKRVKGHNRFCVKSMILHEKVLNQRWVLEMMNPTKNLASCNRFVVRSI